MNSLHRSRQTDIGLFVPTSLDESKTPNSNWYFLVSNGVATPDYLDDLLHQANKTPFSNDLYYTFGNGFD